MRARRERGGVGKGARGVVQFRVGITLDFRGDVATSPALSLPPTHSPTPLPPCRYPPPPPSLLHLRRPPTLPPPPAPPCLVFCHFSEGHPPLVLQGKSTHPDYLGEIDPSARATLYTVHGTYISRRMIFLLLLSSAPTRRGRSPTVSFMEKDRRYVTSNIFFYSAITEIIKN